MSNTASSNATEKRSVVMAYHASPEFHRICNSCKDSLPAKTDSYECTFCRVTFCFGCSLEHEPSHRRALVIVKALSNQPRAQIAEACARCDKRSWYRYSCQTCVYSLCRECWNDKGINMHRHNLFVVVEPAWTISGDSSQTCCKKASFGHCSFCRTSFQHGQSVALCKTCLLRYGQRIYHCGTCEVVSGALHSPDHDAFVWVLQGCKPVESKIHCNKCGADFPSADAVSQHPHSSYTEYLEIDRLEQVILNSYRQCHKKECRTDELTVDGDQQCSACHHKFPSRGLSLCRACNMLVKLCGHCFRIASALHRHDPSNFIVALGENHLFNSASNTTALTIPPLPPRMRQSPPLTNTPQASPSFLYPQPPRSPMFSPAMPPVPFYPPPPTSPRLNPSESPGFSYPPPPRSPMLSPSMAPLHHVQSAPIPTAPQPYPSDPVYLSSPASPQPYAPPTAGLAPTNPSWTSLVPTPVLPQRSFPTSSPAAPPMPPRPGPPTSLRNGAPSSPRPGPPMPPQGVPPMPSRPGPPLQSFSAPPGPQAPVICQPAAQPSKPTVKTAYSKLRKHKKTYALTKLGARIVLGSIIGADVGDVMGTFDGTDIGDVGDIGLDDSGGAMDGGTGLDGGAGWDYSTGLDGGTGWDYSTGWDGGAGVDSTMGIYDGTGIDGGTGVYDSTGTGVCTGGYDGTGMDGGTGAYDSTGWDSGTGMNGGTADNSNVAGGGPTPDPGSGGITASQVNQDMNSTIGVQPCLDVSSLYIG